MNRQPLAKVNPVFNYDFIVDNREKEKELEKKKFDDRPLIFSGSNLRCKHCPHKCQECLDIYKDERKNKAVSGHHPSHSLCWCCEKATKGGCQWADLKKPVPGWVAEKDEAMDSYKVIDCPLFKRGRG